MNRRLFLKIAAMFAALPVMSEVQRSFAAQPTPLGGGPGGAGRSLDAKCVNDFFQVAHDDYGWNPPEVVEQANLNGFSVRNVGGLRRHVANAEIGIFDTGGEYHICT